MKHAIRREILSLRENHEETERTKKDEIIKKKLFSLPEFKKAKSVLFYVSIKGEVRTKDMIRESLKSGKKVLVPVSKVKEKTLEVSGIRSLKDMVPKSFGVPEPKNPKIVSPEAIDLVIIPGIAFDGEGNRVGYGMGFYDRFLEKIRKHIPLIALAYDFQIVSEIPTHGKDVRVHKIVTEKEIIEC